MIKLDKNKIAEYNFKLLSDNTIKEYKYLNKVIGRNIKFLGDFIKLTKDLKINDWATYKNDYYFFISQRFLELKTNRSLNMINKYINLYVTLGLLQKVPNLILEELNPLLYENMVESKQSKSHKIINLYCLPLWTDKLLELANERAELMNDNNFTIRTFNKDYVRIVFDSEFANRVYNDNRKPSQQDYYMCLKLKAITLEQLENRGYTTKKDIVTQFAETNPELKNKADTILNNYFITLLISNELEYRKANKELKERFNLESYIHIIYKET